MKKIIILFTVLLIPFLGYGQTTLTNNAQYKPDVNFESPRMLQNASENLIDGITFSIVGMAVPAVSILVANNTNKTDKEKNDIIIAGCAVGVISSTIGVVLIYKGCKKIGDAGARLEYELGAMNSKIALKF